METPSQNSNEVGQAIIPSSNKKKVGRKSLESKDMQRIRVVLSLSTPAISNLTSWVQQQDLKHMQEQPDRHRGPLVSDILTSLDRWFQENGLTIYEQAHIVKQLDRYISFQEGWRAAMSVTQRRWLQEGEEANGRYVVELSDGRRGEADTALALMDLVVAQDYSDCDDRESQIMELGKALKDVAAFNLSAMGIRAQVYSGAGLFFDNGAAYHQDEMEEVAAVKLENEEPVILDFWNEWTTIASLIKCGYLKLYEKAHLLPENQHVQLAKSLTIFENLFGQATDDKQAYWEVTPDQVTEEPVWMTNYIPVGQR